MTIKTEFDKTAYQRRIRQEAREAGKCVCCYHRPVKPGLSQRRKPYTICAQCLDHQKAASRKKYQPVEVDRRYSHNRPDAAPLCPVCAQPMRQCQCC